MKRWLATFRRALVVFVTLIPVICVVPLKGQDQQSSVSGQARASLDAEAELRAGIDLTSHGHFAEAIPHFLAAQGHVSDEFAVNFNLALCYVGINQFPQAVQILNELRNSGHADANVENLLAQAYVGTAHPKEAFDALQRAATLTPRNEKLYVFVADACVSQQDYDLGLRVVDFGLQALPNSARLHYQRAYFLSLLDQFDIAKADFDLAASLDPQSEIAFVAGAQKNLFEGNLPEAIRIARTAVRQERANYLSLSILGEALVRSGATPGQPEFAEAKNALMAAVAARPNYASAQIALGSLLITAGEMNAAVEHLKKGREFDPGNPAVYSHLAVAYRRLGKPEKAEEMLQTLAKINAQQAAKINTAPGERKAVPGAGRAYPITQQP
jgi:tetratricopeptide (TPR) repeat protein